MYILTMYDYDENLINQIGVFVLYYHNYEKAKKKGISYIKDFLGYNSLNYEYEVCEGGPYCYCYGELKNIEKILFDIEMIRTED